MKFLSAPRVGALLYVIVSIATLAMATIGPTILRKPATTASVVEVMVGDGHGTGFYIGNNQFITAEHVTAAAGNGKITIKAQDGEQSTATIVWADHGKDVALIQSDTPFANVKATSLACSLPDAKIGTRVTSIGYPMGLGLTQTWGKVSSVVRKIFDHRFLVADLTIAPGNSGGPVFEDNGYVVGLSDALPGLGFTLIPFDLIIPRSTICARLHQKKA